MIHCRACGHQIHESALACPSCGAPQGVAATGAGTNPSAPIPDGVKGWSWGAFLFNSLWGVFNGTWIALLALLPGVGLVMAVVLGIKGREWAWKNKRWDSLEHFNRVQRAWSMWGACFMVIPLIGIVAAIALPAYQDYTKRANAAKAAIATREVEKQPVAPEQAPPVSQPQTVTTEPMPTVAVPQPETVAVVARETAPAERAAASGADLIDRAQTCAEGLKCVVAMLDGANPRRPDVIQAAALRLVSLETSEPGDRKSSRDLNTRALAKYSANDFDGAIELFSQAAQINPRDAEIKANLGLAYVRASKPRDAVRTLVGALQLDPRRSSAWAPMAEALDQAQTPDGAVAALLLTYEFSANKQKTIDFFHSRASSDQVGDSLKVAYAQALKTVEAGY